MKMMKKIFLGLIVICLCLTVNNVEAISKDAFEEHNNISIPYLIYNTGSKITVYDTENYDLYAQWLEISMDQYNAINSKLETYNDKVETRNDYVTKNNPNPDDYDSVDAYNKAYDEFKIKVDELDANLATLLNEYYELIPNFDDSKWEKLTDDTVYLPEANFTGTKPYILYVKLDDKENSIVDYDFGILEVDGEKKSADTVPEVDDTKWKELKSGIKTNETISYFNNDEYGVSFDETNDNVFKIVISKKDGSLTYEFVLNYNDGIMRYELSGDEPDGFEFINSMIIPGVIQEFCKLYDYDYDVFVTWLEENEGKLTLVGNGITYELKEYNYEDKGEGYDFSMSGDYFESLSINIAYPITGFTNSGMGGAVEEEKEPNANTGDLDIIMIASAMMIFAGTAIVAYKKINS